MGLAPCARASSDDTMPLDSMNLMISLASIVGGTVAILLLLKQNQKPGIAVGIGGSLILLGLILLARTYDLIYGISVWISMGSALFILISFSYTALRKASSSG